MFATWLYVSSSSLGQNADAEIANIRSIAEARNPELGLTGVLLFSGRHFALFLEGAEANSRYHEGVDFVAMIGIQAL